MPDLKDTLTVQNVVASTSIGQEFDLEALSLDLEPSQYDPDQFPGLIYRVEEPSATCLIFRSGKVVSTGANSIAAVEEALTTTFAQLRELGIDVPENPDYTVQNIVSSGDLGTTLNLNAVAVGLGLERVEYEPEQFPGLVYRPEDVDTVALLFGSGKVVITGGKQPEDAETTIETVAQQLEELHLLD